MVDAPSIQVLRVSSFEMGASKIVMVADEVNSSCGKAWRSLLFERTSMLIRRSGICEDRRHLRIAEPVPPVAPRTAWIGMTYELVQSRVEGVGLHFPWRKRCI